MRVSNYNIYIPLPGGEQYLLVHGYTGAVDFVDAEIARCLQKYFTEYLDAVTLNISPEIRGALEKRGYLTDLSVEEEVAFVAQFAQKIHKWRSGQPEFWFIPSYNCQLRCKYCFERSIQKRGEREGWLTQQMSLELVDAAFAAMSQIEGENTIKRIILYGGEPLMLANRRVIQYIVERGLSLGYHFGAITNGIDLYYYDDLIGPGKIAQLMITIDGPRSTHNQLRVYSNGKETFDQIVRSIQFALHKGCQISLRINIAWEVLTRLEEFIQFIQELGWDKDPNLRIHCRAVHTNQQYRCGLDCAGQVTLIDDAIIANFAHQTGLHQRLGMWPADSRMASILDKLFHGRPGTALSSTSCGAHYGFYIFDPFGDIYPCSRLVGNSHHRIGTFVPSLVWNENRRRWHERAVYNMPTCLKCPFVLYCGGGCAQQALLEKGDIYYPYCNNFNERFRVAMVSYYLNSCNLSLR